MKTTNRRDEAHYVEGVRLARAADEAAIRLEQARAAYQAAEDAYSAHFRTHDHLSAFNAPSTTKGA